MELKKQTICPDSILCSDNNNVICHLISMCVTATNKNMSLKTNYRLRFSQKREEKKQDSYIDSNRLIIAIDIDL